MSCSPTGIACRPVKRGYATGDTCRGYKIFGCWSGVADGAGMVPGQLTLGPMNRSDPDAATTLIDGLAHGLPPPRKKSGAGLGHRDHDPARLRSIELLEGPSDFGRNLYTLRGDIERCFAHMGNFGGGLQPLPNFVRRPRRVAFWSISKLVFNGIRICRLHGLTP